MNQSDTISVDALADLAGISGRTVRTLVTQKVLPASDNGQLPREAAIKALFAHYRAAKSTKAEHEAEKLLKTREERQRLERERLHAEGELLTLAQWRQLTAAIIPPLRQFVRNLLKTEIPASCTGKSESDLRTFGNRKYNEFLRDARAASLRLGPGESVAIEPVGS